MIATAKQKYCNDNFEIDIMGENLDGELSYDPLDKGDHTVQMPS